MSDAMAESEEQLGTQMAEKRNSENVVLSVKNLVKTYGDATAVDNITFDLHRGEFLTLLGESGSGKSTTLMMVAGFETPKSGTIHLGGKDLTNTPAHQRGLGVVFQNYALFPNMTVLDNVAYPLKMRGISKRDRRKKAREALDSVRLSSHAEHRPAELSGGQQQRVALARALVFEPDVLLMDEPLGALDKKLREHLQAEIRTLHRERGVTVIYVTHDQDEALSLSDRIAVMRDGRIEQIGTPHATYSQPNSRFVADFVGESTIIDGTYRNENGPVLETPSGVSIPVAPDTDFVPGDRICLMVRPEAARFIAPGASEASNQVSLPVTIHDKGYYGRDIRYQCRGTTADFTSVMRTSETEELQPETTESATISWSAGAARVFPLEG